MKKWPGILFAVLLVFQAAACAFAEDGAEEYTGRLFTVSVPKDIAELCDVEVGDTSVSFYHRASREAECGGFAFAIRAYLSPVDYNGMPGGRKIGELTAADGTVYDVVLMHPTDVQYDFTSEKSTEEYKKIYDLGEETGRNTVGAGGSTFVFGAGCAGEMLYGEVLARHVLAVREQWDASRLEEENMSTMYDLIENSDGDPLSRIGFVYHDINQDGIDELLIGEISEGAWKGVIYDIYTMVDRQCAHVVSGWDRNRFYAYKNAFLCNEFSGGAMMSGWIVYDLESNSTELWPQIGFKTDGYENAGQPWFIAYGRDVTDDVWENVTEEQWTQTKANFEDYERFDFTPLSAVA